MKLAAALAGFTHGLTGRAVAGFGITPNARPCEALGMRLGKPRILPL